MPLKYFDCPLDGQNKTLKDCKVCPEPCDPLPLLATIFNSRQVVKGVYHVTEILNPRQVTYLSRKHDYSLPPESMTETALGIAWHELIEKTVKSDKTGLFKGFASEDAPFVVPINGVILTGKPDLKDYNRKILWDFKTSGAYSVWLFTENQWDDPTWDKYCWQTNIYRTYGFPEAEHINLHVKIKGWNKKLAEVDIKNKITIPVPIIDSDKVKRFVSKRIADVLEDERTAAPPPCTKEEMWINKKGEPKRCLEYCGGKQFCKQFQNYINKEA